MNASQNVSLGINQTRYGVVGDWDALVVTSSSFFTMTNQSFGNNTTEDGPSDNLGSFYDDLLRPLISLCVALAGLPSIALLIAVTLTPKYRKYSYSLYLTVMSIYDFIFITNEFGDTIAQIKNKTYLRSYLIWDVPCRIYEHLFYSSMTISMWMNVAVSIDRFIVIAFPFKKDSWCNRRNSWIVCGIILGGINSIGIVYIVFGEVVYYEDDGYYCNGAEILADVDTYLSYMGGVVPCIIILFVFTTLSVHKLYRIKMKRMAMTSSQSSNAKDKTSQATIALVSIGIIAFITQMPYVVNEMIRLYAFRNDQALYNTLWYGDIPGYNTAVKIFEALSFVINIQNFYVMFTLNRNFRNDVAILVTCQKASKRTMTKTSMAGTTMVSEISSEAR